ncbi:MAG TPA: formate dehydrogenase accessory sulfurtransferase FdhD [Luteitalea sp.]|nr:formate dehydrogenase accessory sulfurtransferase FdhD [Luteitalea sp.]
MNAPPAPGWHAVEIERIRPGARAVDLDRCAVEAPLDIRLHGQSFVMTMRTPGDDADLAAGFLLSEGVITSADDLVALVPSSDGTGVDVTLGSAAAAQLERHMAARRQVTATSACGVCGRQSADALAFDAAPITATWTIPSAVVDVLPARLRAAQTTFEQTGGLHAAGVFALDGTLLESAEDVGRHNAVDKVLGRLLRARRLPLSGSVLCVSGRASFELVQKAVRGGVPMLVAVSAPSSLAIDLARQRGVTLAGFVRGDGFNVYAHAQRVA